MQLSALTRLLVLSAALCGLSEAALFPKSSKVTQLNASNFKREVLDIEKPTMVAFTAPWCGHCQKLVPDYSKVASQLDGVVKLAAIDCDEEKNKPLCGQYGIQGFPTLKLFPPTKKRLPKDYQGARAAKEIATYMIDSLPMSAKKLKAEELQQYTDLDEGTPKVILFSKKPTSSPLYKSLALDFRKSLSFAFLRGDQQPVRAAARVHLGVDIDESKLPLLIVVPSRKGEELDKKQIKTYTGQLKYNELNKWIKDTLPEAASGKVKKPSVQPSSRSEPSRQKPVKLDADIEEVPTGAQREWRVDEDMTEEQRKEKMGKLADMINEASRKREQQAEDIAKDVKGAAKDKYTNVKDTVNDEYKNAKQTADRISGSADTMADTISSKVDEVKQAAQDTIADAYENVKQNIADVGAKVADAGVAGKQALNAATQKFGDTNSLKDNMQQWLKGENVDWSGDYASKFERAQEEAEKLVREDPIKAEQLALDGEKWLAEHLITDIDLMIMARDKGNTNPSLSDEKLQRVQNMYDELLKRIEARENRLQSQSHSGIASNHHDEL